MPTVTLNFNVPDLVYVHIFECTLYLMHLRIRMARVDFTHGAI